MEELEEIGRHSRDFLLGRIHGLVEAEAIAAARPTAFAFSIRQEIDDLLTVLRSALVDGRHA
jgi:hypothetical protein